MNDENADKQNAANIWNSVRNLISATWNKNIRTHPHTYIQKYYIVLCS